MILWLLVQQMIAQPAKSLCSQSHRIVIQKQNLQHSCYGCLWYFLSSQFCSICSIAPWKHWEWSNWVHQSICAISLVVSLQLGHKLEFQCCHQYKFLQPEATHPVIHFLVQMLCQWHLFPSLSNNVPPNYMLEYSNLLFCQYWFE